MPHQQWSERLNNIQISQEMMQEVVLSLISFAIMIVVIWLIWNYLIARNADEKRSVWFAGGLWLLARLLLIH